MPTDTSKPDWVEKTYRTLFKEAFYKVSVGGLFISAKGEGVKRIREGLGGEDLPDFVQRSV